MKAGDKENNVKKELGWRPLDNTAKIFPVIADEDMSQVFRLSVTLKESVDPEILQKALEEIIPNVDKFRVKLRRGLFWYYFEENKKIPKVKRENTYPCRYIDPHRNQKFLFRVTYFEHRINFEVFHALTDGLGAVTFLKSLVKKYLDLVRGTEEYWVSSDSEIPQEKPFEVSDSYLENYQENSGRSYSSAPAYQLKGRFHRLGSGQVLHGYVNIKELKALCKHYDVSITKYLAAVMIWSIWKEYLGGKPHERPIALNLPVNLRAFFGSETMANFFAVTIIGYLFKKPDMDFDTLLGIISRQMDRKIDKKRLEESISYNVSNEKKWYLRAIPLVIKKPALAWMFRMKDQSYTMTLSNIGLIRMEPEYASEIENFQVMIGVSRRQPLKCAVCAFGSEVVITFTSVFSDSRLQKRFFRKLRADGIRVRFEGNELSAAKKKDIYPKMRSIVIVRKGGSEKAARMAKQVGQTGGTAAKGLRDYVSGRRDWREELSRRLHV